MIKKQCLSALAGVVLLGVAPLVSAKLFVGNISHSTTEQELHGLFSQYGSVANVTIVIDRDTGRS